MACVTAGSCDTNTGSFQNPFELTTCHWKVCSQNTHNRTFIFFRCSHITLFLLPFQNLRTNSFSVQYKIFRCTKVWLNQNTNGVFFFTNRDHAGCRTDSPLHAIACRTGTGTYITFFEFFWCCRKSLTHFLFANRPFLDMIDPAVIALANNRIDTLWLNSVLTALFDHDINHCIQNLSDI